MNPSNFDEANTTLGPPAGVPEAAPDGSIGIRSIRAWRGVDDAGRALVISHWKPTIEEVEAMRRGAIYSSAPKCPDFYRPGAA